MINRSDIVSALARSGLEPGMTVFSHANIAFFGRVEGADSMDALISIMFEAFDEVLGNDGTLVLPVFTYSFGSDKSEKTFDLQKTLSNTSGMGNALIGRGDGARSCDPMLSTIAVGAKAQDLTADIDPVCFGSNSVWARLHRENAMICNLNFDSGSTFLHWVEREIGVSYRTDIRMRGTIVDQGSAREAEVIYSGRALDDPLAAPKFEAYHEVSKDAGISRIVELGRGQIVTQSCHAAKELLGTLLLERPGILTKQGSQV